MGADVKRLLLIPVGLTALVLAWLLWLNPAAAATVTMTKNGGGNWSDPTLWDTGTVPTADDEVILASTGGATVIVDVPVTVQRLELRGATIGGWQTLSVTNQTLTVTDDLYLYNFARLNQGPGGIVIANSYRVGGVASGGAVLSEVSWIIAGTATNRAVVRGRTASSGIATGNSNANSQEEEIQWAYADFDLDGSIVLPLKGTNIARLWIDHCLFAGTGYLDFGIYMQGATGVRITNNDFRFSGQNPLAKGVYGNLVIRRQVSHQPGTDQRFWGNVVWWTPYGNEAVGQIQFNSMGGTWDIQNNVFQDVVSNYMTNTGLCIGPDIYDIHHNLFFYTQNVLITGAELQSYCGVKLHDNLFLAQRSNSHIIKLRGVGTPVCEGPWDYVYDNVFDIADGGADIIMLGHSDVEVTRNLFLGRGTAVNAGLSISGSTRDIIDPESVNCQVLVRRNTLYSQGAGTTPGAMYWNGETSYHNGDLRFANNLVADSAASLNYGYSDQNFWLGSHYADLLKYVDYTWWWNDNGGDYVKYRVLSDLLTEGVSEGFGKFDREGDPRFKNKLARVATMDSYLQGDELGSETRALEEFKKRNQNVPGEVFKPSYVVQSALNYLRNAFTPLNLDLDGSGLDGEDIGAIDIQAIPSSPAAPTLRSTTPVSIKLGWLEPVGSVIENYAVEYKLTDAVNWSNYPALSYRSYLTEALEGGVEGTVAGLETGLSYQFRVMALSSAGQSPWSTASGVLIPFGPAAVPTGVSVIEGNAQVEVAFVPPTNTGGLPLLGYRIDATPGGASVTGTASPLVLAGLTNSTRYTLTLRAFHEGGDGAAVTFAVTPHEPIPPHAPELLTLRRAPGAAFDWQYQYAAAPTAPGETCIEGQHAWDDTFLYVCIPGGRWVYVQPNKLW